MLWLVGRRGMHMHKESLDKKHFVTELYLASYYSSNHRYPMPKICDALFSMNGLCLTGVLCYFFIVSFQANFLIVLRHSCFRADQYLVFTSYYVTPKYLHNSTPK